MKVGDILLEVIGLPTQGQIEEVAAVRKSKRARVAAEAKAKADAAKKVPIKPFDKKSILKSPGTILRYPYEALTDETDYLQIDIREYNPVKSITGGLTSNGSIRNNELSYIIQDGKVSDIRRSNDVSKLTTTELNKTKKILNAKGSILLPIPSNVQDANSVSYSEGKLDKITSDIYTDLAGKLTTTTPTPGGQGNAFTQIASGLSTRVGNIGKRFLNDPQVGQLLATNLFAQAANIPLGGSLTRDQVIARSSGQVLNQNVELLFNGVTLRSFKFSFKFTPRNPNEANQVYYIIESLKLNMAAKVSGDGLFLNTPNVFELTYKQGNGPHPFLNSFKQCVLTDMSINYTGEGTYAVYSDATPVSMILELGFKELEPIYDLDYDDEFLPGVGY